MEECSIDIQIASYSVLLVVAVAVTMAVILFGVQMLMVGIFVNMITMIVSNGVRMTMGVAMSVAVSTALLTSCVYMATLS